MSISHIHSFLVHPSKNSEEQPAISGTRLRLEGKLFSMLSAIYDGAMQECKIEVVFRKAADGRQDNACRDVVIGYLKKPGVTRGRLLASRLQSVTTLRSGLGLLFLLVGTKGREKRLMLARFPADQGIVANERQENLDVEFIERIFMKSAKAYKAAYYHGDSLEGAFWEGRAVDKQINGARELSNYWIHGFLESELRTTPAAGTKRLAMAVREAIRVAPDVAVRQELMSAVTLLRGKDGKRVSGDSVAEQFELSPEAEESLRRALPRPELMEETFQFDRDEFDKHVMYRSVELDNGALLIAENSTFESVFRREQMRAAEGRVRYITEGNVVSEKLRKTR